MPTLVLTMGIPASGKTAIAQRIADDMNAPLLSVDAIRTNRAMNRSAFLADTERIARECLTSGGSVVIDACSVGSDLRGRWLGLARACGADAHLIVVPCSVDLALSRNRTRADPVPERVIRTYGYRMRGALGAVGAEGWDRITEAGSQPPAGAVEAAEW